MAQNKKAHIREVKKVLGVLAKMNAMKLLFASEDAARQFIDVLNPEDIATWQPGIATVWRHYRDALIAGNKPSRNLLLQSLREAAEAAPDSLDDDVVNEAIVLVRDAYKMVVTPDLQEKGISTVKRMIEEQIYLNVQSDFDGGHVPADIPDFFNKLQERVAHSAPSTLNNSGDIFAGDWWKTIKVARRMTHVKVYDRILGGGAAGGWVVGFAAPFGGGKTALVSDAACAIVQNEKPLGKRRPVVAIFTFETPRTEYLLRFLSRYAQIPSKRLQELGYEGLRGKDDPPEQYEKRLFKNNKFLSERGRAAAAIKAMRGGVVLYDVSNMEEQNNSIKSIPAIANAVRSLQTEETYVHSVWIDHTSAMVDHVIATSEGQYSKDDRTDLIRTLPQDLRKSVAKKYDVPVILLAQLTGLANAKSPAAPMGGTEVEGCKSFGMYLDINVVSGRGTPDGYRAWYSDKNRHGPIVPRLIAQFDGNYYHFSDATEHMMIDEATRTFMRADEGRTAGVNPGKYVPIAADDNKSDTNQRQNLKL